MDRSEFNIKLHGVCMDLNVSCNDDTADQYMDKLFAEWESVTDSKVTLTKWLKQRLKQDFKCISDKPKWVDDPEWPFYEGTPMVFVGQILSPKNSDLEILAGTTQDNVFYLFNLLIDGTIEGVNGKVWTFRNVVQMRF